MELKTHMLGKSSGVSYNPSPHLGLLLACIFVCAPPPPTHYPAARPASWNFLDKHQSLLLSGTCSQPRPRPQRGSPVTYSPGHALPLEAHSRVVQDVELLAFGEGKVFPCPGLIVIQGDEHGHSCPCRIRDARQSRAEVSPVASSSPARPWTPHHYNV